MEILLALSISYLILTLIFSSDEFIVQGVAFIALGSIYIISLMIENYNLFLLPSTIFTTALLIYKKFAISDVIKVLFISYIAIFWLSTAEFMDGYVYSYLLVAICVAFVSNIIFTAENRRTLALISILLPYLFIYSVSGDVELENMLLSMVIAWVYTSITTFQLPSKSNMYKKNSEIRKLIPELKTIF